MANPFKRKDRNRGRHRPDPQADRPGATDDSGCPRGGAGRLALPRITLPPPRTGSGVTLNRTQESCTGYEFAAGTVVGARTWTVDKRGRLVGNWDGVWRPGENVAECRRLTHGAGVLLDVYGDLVARLAAQAGYAATEPYPDPPPRCEVSPGESCSCGIYAYVEPVATGADDLVGIVEGYGRTLIGSRGFRSEKAWIVAINFPLDRSPRDFARLYPEVEIFRSRREMYAAHPLSAEYAEDFAPGDDFWEAK